MKNPVLLENYYLPGEVERQIGAFIDDYNNERYQESLKNVTRADGYLGGRQGHCQSKGKDQETDNPTAPLATSKTSRTIEPEPPENKPLRW